MTAAKALRYPSEMLDHAAIARIENLDRKASVGAASVLPTYGLFELLGAGLGAFHGYKRNAESVPWAVGWGLLGLNFPILTTIAAAYEGFGKPAPNAGLLEPAPKTA